MVIPLLGVKTRCADKSTAEHYEHTYIQWLPNVADNVCKKSILMKSLVFETSNLI